MEPLRDLLYHLYVHGIPGEVLYASLELTVPDDSLCVAAEAVSELGRPEHGLQLVDRGARPLHGLGEAAEELPACLPDRRALGWLNLETFVNEFHWLEVDTHELREEHEVDVLLRLVPTTAVQKVVKSLFIFGRDR